MSAKPRLVDGLEHLVDHFDGFVLDQFGVLHDGEKLLPGVREAVVELRRLGKRLAILSNSAKTAEVALARLPALGLDVSDFEGAVTSGTEALLYMQAEARDGGALGGRRCLCFTWQGEWGDSYRRFAGVEPADVGTCDFMLADGCDCILSGGEPRGTTLSSDGQLAPAYSSLLVRAVERGVPMVCANPDLRLVMPDGSFGHMPGVIAAEYEKLGGDVRYFGKPHAAHFHKAVALLGCDSSRVAHVGDSLIHDIAGANGAAIQSVFVCGGIHRTELFGSEVTEPLPLPSEQLLENVFREHGAEPSFVVPSFQFRSAT